jgi:transposase-like protein
MSLLANYMVKDTVDHFEKCCPECGKDLKLKRIKKGGFHRRGLRSWICTDCGYAVYDSNPREKGITEGNFGE